MGEKQQWVIYQKDGEQKNGKSSNNLDKLHGSEPEQLEFDFGIMETIDQSLNMRQA
jgi:hypothetical protein